MPVPSAAINVPISAELSILSGRARSTFRILPRSGRIAWYLRLRPCLAEPPAESPSTMNSSDRAGSRSWQSASLPGREAKSRAPLRRVSSRALRAASRAAEPGEMAAAVALRNVVGETQHRLVIAVGPFHGDLQHDAVPLAAHDDGRLVDGRLVAVEVAHEGLDAAFVVQLDRLGLDPTRIGQEQAHPGIEEGQFAQAMLQGRVIEFGLGEGLARRQEIDVRA